MGIITDPAGRLRDLLTIYNPSRNLRSSSHHLLSVGYMRTVPSTRCYKHSAATNWNYLPHDITDCSSVSVFKRKLKSHLFSIAYIAYCHVSPQRLRITFLLHMALYKFFILYCIVLCPMETWTKSTFWATFSRKFIFVTIVHFSFVPFIYYYLMKHFYELSVQNIQ